jgi:hypothetical protein
LPANEAVPETQAGRIKWVAERVYPAGRWRARIAKGLGIGRSTLYRFLSGRKRSRRGLDDKLIVLMARERIASQRRARDSARAEKVFAQQFVSDKRSARR